MKELILDTYQSAISWRKWYLFGMQNIRAAYSRSRIGQFWISLLFLIMVVSLGVIYSTLWQSRIDEFLPFFALSQMIWLFMSGVTQGSSTAYQVYAGHIKTQYQPTTLFVFAIIFRHLVVMLHNAVVVAAVFLYFLKPLHWTAILALPGLVVLIANCYWIALVNAFVCARFRDIPAVVTSLVQIAFFVSPILWPPSAIKNPDLRVILVDLNPVANLVAIVRDPLLGLVPSMPVYVFSALFTFFGLSVAGFVFAKTHRRLVYWI